MSASSQTWYSHSSEPLQGRDFLVLSELRQLQSIEDLPIDMNHLGTLFVLDADRNGRVTLQASSGAFARCAMSGADPG